MRPTLFALCAAGLLLASGAHCASADDGGSLAPLISSGTPSSDASGPATGARRMLSDDDPVSPAQAEPAPLRQEPHRQDVQHQELQRHEPMRLRDEPTLGDQSWTSAPVQPASSANESSRSVKHFSDSGMARPGGASSSRANPSASPQLTSAASAPVHPAHASAPGESAAAASAAVQPAAIQPAGGAYAGSPGSHLRSHVAQAQYTSSESSAAQPRGAEAGAAAPRPDSLAAAAAGDVHRPLKPPTASDSATDEKRSSGTVQMFVSVISSLLIVVGLLLGAAWCYRKATPNLAGSLPKQALQVLGRTALAPRQQLILVRFGPKLVLMSNLQGEVRTISEINDPLEVDRICGMCESSQAGSISDSFRTVLHNIGRTG